MYAKAEDGNYKFGKQQLIDYIKSEMERKHGSYADTDNGGRRLETYDQFAKGLQGVVTQRRVVRYRQASDCSSQYKKVSHVMMFMLGYGSTPFMRITPDNIVEFIAPPSVVWQHSQSIVSSAYRWIPFMFERHRRSVSSTTYR